MAQRSSVVKAQLQIADMDRHYYQDHSLTLAQHPSETEQRLMVRLLAFALNASEQLQFSSNLSDEGEPELSEKNLHGGIELWVAFGQPDEKWLRKACQRAERVKLYAYGGRAVPIWLQQNAKELKRFDNLELWEVPEQDAQALAGLCGRSMQLQCTINEGQIWLSDGDASVQVELKRLSVV